MLDGRTSNFNQWDSDRMIFGQSGGQQLKTDTYSSRNSGYVLETKQKLKPEVEISHRHVVLTNLGCRFVMNAAVYSAVYCFHVC